MKQWIVDAFTEHLFEGNPAAICLAEHFPSDDVMAAIAQENRLSETAFGRFALPCERSRQEI